MRYKFGWPIFGGAYIHGGIFPESSVQFIAQVSNRDKTLSRSRILWNVLILSSSILSYLNGSASDSDFIFLLKDYPNNCAYDSH